MEKSSDSMTIGNSPRTKNRLVLIRRAKNSDFRAISECYWNDPEAPWDIYSHPNLLRRYVGSRGFLVAELRGHVVGFVHYRLFRKRPWFDPRVKKYGQILELHVKDSFQGLGIGHRLMITALKELESQGVAAIYTHTDETNRSALRLYRGLGFTPLIKTFYLKRKSSKRRKVT